MDDEHGPSLVAKRIRALKKKLAKIAALEQKESLNDDQLELFNSRDKLEHTLAEFESLQAHLGAPPPPPERRVDDKDLLRLLKLVHVAGKADLPKPVEYFCKSILGTVGTDSFGDSLQHALAEAKLYLQGSPREIAPSLSYADIERVIDDSARTLRSPFE